MCCATLPSYPNTSRLKFFTAIYILYASDGSYLPSRKFYNESWTKRFAHYETLTRAEEERKKDVDNYNDYNFIYPDELNVNVHINWVWQEFDFSCAWNVSKTRKINHLRMTFLFERLHERTYVNELWLSLFPFLFRVKSRVKIIYEQRTQVFWYVYFLKCVKKMKVHERKT